jgi:predicted nucleic acid-binding protein
VSAECRRGDRTPVIDDRPATQRAAGSKLGAAVGGRLATRTRARRTVSTIDAQIAAISRQHQATLATRNTADFTDTGLDLINPWTAT